MQESTSTPIPDQTVNAIIALIRSLGSRFYSEFDGQVKYGHFKGYRLLPESSWSKTDLASKLFGLYEKEVKDKIFEKRDEFDVAVVLGAADGYYAVGLIISGVVERSICFETSPQGQEIIRQTAALNGVAEKVSVFGSAGPDFLDVLGLDETALQRTIFVIDIEGGEFAVLSAATIGRLANAHVMVELHGDMVPQGQDKERKLIADLRSHFDCEILTTRNRGLAGIPELANLSDNIRWLVCSEGRPYRMRWIYGAPRRGPWMAKPVVAAARVAAAQPGRQPIAAAAGGRDRPPLLYYCAFGESYFKEAIISIRSWRDIGGYTGQIVVFCDARYEVEGSLGIEVGRLNIDVIVVDKDTIRFQQDAAAFRLKIFERIPEDRIFVYSDTDMICIQEISLAEMYKKCDLSKVNLYGYGHRNQGADTQAAYVTDDPEIIAQKAICSGFAIFTRDVEKDFREVSERFARQKAINGVWEQPMFNYVLLKNKSACVNLDDFFVEERAPPRNGKPTAVLNHFCGLRGSKRFIAMKASLDSLLAVRRHAGP